jgi:hypothetical protein
VCTTHFHLLGRENPFCLIEIEFVSLCVAKFSWPHEEKRSETQRGPRRRLTIKPINCA